MRLPSLRFPVVGVLALAAVLALPVHAGKTLESILSRGHVVCGVHTVLSGFSAADASGRWVGMDVDVCRALAAAVLGDGQKVQYVPLTAQQRFVALQSGEIDVLSRNTTFSLARDASMGLHQTVVTFYDGQGFMVPKKSPIRRVRQLKGHTVCVQSGTTNAKNLVDFSQANALAIKPVVFERVDTSVNAYVQGRCAAYTTDASGLASIRSKDARSISDHVILPELISKEPLGPMVRRGDDEWFAVVKWVIYGLIEAEEKGVTQANVLRIKAQSTDPVVQRLLGSQDNMGKLLGLDHDWMVRAIQTTGNYGEIFERNVGANSELRLPRGLNRLWKKGGLIYAYPLQ